MQGASHDGIYVFIIGLFSKSITEKSVYIWN